MVRDSGRVYVAGRAEHDGGGAMAAAKSESAEVKLGARERVVAIGGRGARLVWTGETAGDIILFVAHRTNGKGGFAHSGWASLA